MFGYVMANPQELRPEQRERYLGCYCGICRAIGEQNSLASRLALNYDMVFLALLLSSLYEPAEEQSSGRCLIHPLSPRPWRRSEAIRYAADMNVALAYFSADDHWQDDRRPDALALRRLLRPHYEAIQSRFPRQCRAMETCIRDLRRMEAEHCPNPDLPANCFGLLMAELFCWREDRWSGYLRQMAMALGRQPWTTGGICTGAAITPSGLWEEGRTPTGGKIIWFWKWDGPPRPTKCYPSSRTKTCWTTSCIVASG